MIWRKDGLSACQEEYEPWLRDAAAETGQDLEEYRLRFSEAMGPIFEQLDENPRDAKRADVRPIGRTGKWFVAFLEGEFDTWVTIYEITTEATAESAGYTQLHAMLPLRAPRVQELLFPEDLA